MLRVYLTELLTLMACYGKLLNSSGSECAADDTVATGNKLVIYKKDGSIYAQYDVVIYGDVNGDGRITSMDMLYIKRHILYIKTLSGAYLLAADTNKDSDVTSMDMLYIKRHILDIKYIQQ